MSKEKLPKDIWELYSRYKLSKAISTTIIFALILCVLFWFTYGLPENQWLILHPQNFSSLSAIISSLSAVFFTHFFHRGWEDLLINLLWFIPLGILVLRLEGPRGQLSILTGMLFSGVVVWLIGEKYTVYAGFSGAIFACIGILFVRLLRSGELIVLVLAVGILASFKNLSYASALEFVQSFAWEFGIDFIPRHPEYIFPKDIDVFAYLGGLLGGMAAQIGLHQIALEALHKKRMVTDEEFVVIATRVYHDTPAYMNPMTTQSSAQPSTGTAETEATTEKSRPAQSRQPFKWLRLKFNLLLDKAKLLSLKMKKQLHEWHLAVLKKIQRLRSKTTTAKPEPEKSDEEKSA